MSCSRNLPWRCSRRVAVVFAVLVLLWVPVTDGIAGAATLTPPTARPSWLDLAAEMGQIANSSSSTEATLLTADAVIRNGLNGTTAGYVYSISSDSAQLAVSLRSLITNSKELVTDWNKAHDSAQTAESSWAQVRTNYAAYQPIFIANGCVPGAAQYAACDKAEQQIAAWYDNTARPGVVGPATGNDTQSASGKAIYDYREAEDALTEALSDATEVAFGARTITGDAKDYSGNKEIEAIVQVLGEHKIAKAMSGLIADGTGLRPHLEAQMNEMRTCLATGYQMRIMIAIPRASYPLPPASACAPTP